jgi:hypothetical protein
VSTGDVGFDSELSQQSAPPLVDDDDDDPDGPLGERMRNWGNFN